MRRALDLFCGGGGAARGILAAGFDEVVGIDIADHRRAYPGLFILGDALRPPVRLADFDFVWASPPCQRFSFAIRSRPEHIGRHPNHIDAVRALLRGTVHCIENVPGAPLKVSVKLTGAMFGLGVHRERIFEVGGFEPPFALLVQDRRRVTNGELSCVAGNGVNNAWNIRRKRGKGTSWADLPEGLRNRLRKANSKRAWCDAMQLPDTMTRDEIKEAVPPAYAEFIAREALRQMERFG